jgi:hypothetical protein
MYIPTPGNVIFQYITASNDTVNDGMSWYNRANDFARTLDSNVERAAGVIAALSPNTSWTANMTLAKSAYAGNVKGFPANVAKVNRILDGEAPLDVLGGPKVRAFYANIAEPDVSHSAVIDRHAFDIAVGIRLDDKSRGSLGKKGVYETFAAVYEIAAAHADITVAQMQAITWVQWRIVNGITV